MRHASRLVLLALLLIASAGAWAQEAQLVRITTPRGVTQSFLVVRPAEPKAIVILFAGGHGALGLRSATDMAWGKGNFLVRSRERFLAEGMLVVVVDAPSDHAQGMNAIFRMSAEHAADIEAVIDHVRKEAGVPVWVVGTSMGTFSAAGIAARRKRIDGLALTSTVTRAKPDWTIAQTHPHGVASMKLRRVRVPTLILSHKHDGCAVTPAGDGALLKARLTRAAKVEIVLLEGGLPRISDACEARSEHGFLGIEAEAVAAIAKFIRASAPPAPAR